MSRPLAPDGGNDRIYTPRYIANGLVKHFKPSGYMLEPCAGRRDYQPFYDALKLQSGPVGWCEIDLGRDFFEWAVSVDWIVTNPPWGKFRRFLQHSMEVADNIVFLCLTNAWYMKARQRDIKEAGFGLVEIVHIETPPPPWPQAGFQLGAGWLRRGWSGSTYVHDLVIDKVQDAYMLESPQQLLEK